jgi:hypothetical protein
MTKRRRATKRSLAPTRKWWAATVTALAGWAIAFVNVHGHWTETIIIAGVTLVSQRAIAWLVPNVGTPGGVAREDR